MTDISFPPPSHKSCHSCVYIYITEWHFFLGLRFTSWPLPDSRNQHITNGNYVRERWDILADGNLVSYKIWNGAAVDSFPKWSNLSKTWMSEESVVVVGRVVAASGLAAAALLLLLPSSCLLHSTLPSSCYSNLPKTLPYLPSPYHTQFQQTKGADAEWHATKAAHRCHFVHTAYCIGWILHHILNAHILSWRVKCEWMSYTIYVMMHY